MNEILDQLLTTLQTAFTTSFVRYFKGRAVLVAQADLPILMVYGLTTKQAHSGTVRDKAEYRIAVEARISVKTYLDAESGDGDKLDTLERLVDLVEDRESDGDLKAQTIMGIVNANLTVGGRVLFTDNMEVSYEPYMESSKFPAARAVVTFTAYDRPNRV